MSKIHVIFALLRVGSLSALCHLGILEPVLNNAGHNGSLVRVFGGGRGGEAGGQAGGTRVWGEGAHPFCLHVWESAVARRVEEGRCYSRLPR